MYNPNSYSNFQRISSPSQQQPNASNQMYQSGQNPWAPRFPFFPSGYDYMNYFMNYRAPAPAQPTTTPPPTTTTGGSGSAGAVSDPYQPPSSYPPGYDSRGISMG